MINLELSAWISNEKLIMLKIGLKEYLISKYLKFVNIYFLDKFHGNIKSKLYIRPKSNALCFAIQHFAGRVVYQAEGFLDKNRHFLAPEIVQLLRTSVVDTVRYLFQCPITKTGNLFSASPAPPTPLGTRVS